MIDGLVTKFPGRVWTAGSLELKRIEPLNMPVYGRDRNTGVVIPVR